MHKKKILFFAFAVSMITVSVNILIATSSSSSSFAGNFFSNLFLFSSQQYAAFHSTYGGENDEAATMLSFRPPPLSDDSSNKKRRELQQEKQDQQQEQQEQCNEFAAEYSLPKVRAPFLNLHMGKAGGGMYKQGKCPQKKLLVDEDREILKETTTTTTTSPCFQRLPAVDEFFVVRLSVSHEQRTITFFPLSFSRSWRRIHHKQPIID